MLARQDGWDCRLVMLAGSEILRLSQVCKATRETVCVEHDFLPIGCRGVGESACPHSIRLILGSVHYSSGTTCLQLSGRPSSYLYWGMDHLMAGCRREYIYKVHHHLSSINIPISEQNVLFHEALFLNPIPSI